MSKRARIAVKTAGAVLGLLLMAAIAAPYIDAGQYGLRLKWSIERALGRRVELGSVRLSLWRGPRFTVDRVTIHEDPVIGIEPIVYVQDPGSLEVVPSIPALFAGKLVIAAIHLDSASINLTKSSPGSEEGNWNFSSFVNLSTMGRVPKIRVRNSRINFKFGDTKSVFYLMDTDLDIAPSRSGVWSVSCTAMPARTDRAAQGLGSFALRGRWYVAPERVDMDLELDRAGLGELTALLRGHAGMVHGSITSRLHLGGPIGNIGIQGQLNIEDVHRWDLLPPHGQGWPFAIRGRLNLLSQELELQSTSEGGATPPLSVRFRATDYLSHPQWAVAWNWNRFPLEPLMELATHMGASFPSKLKLSGTIDGAVSYSGDGGLQGGVSFHDTALTIPDSPPVRFEQAFVVMEENRVRLSPALVRTADQAEAQIEADYALEDGTLDLSIHSSGMKVSSLHAQVALAAVPWFEQVKSGEWKGQLRYRNGAGTAGWTGRLDLSDARIAVPGFSEPLLLSAARAQIDGTRVALDRMQARIGKVEFGGEYRYEPGATRPHRVRLQAQTVNAAALEAALMPSIRHSSGLIARALGRASAPEWLKKWSVDGTIRIDDLVLAGSHIEDVGAHLVWDRARVELGDLQAKIQDATITGSLAIDLRSGEPAYRLLAKLKEVSWQTGKVEAEGIVETSGTGEELLENLSSEGTFSGSALDFGSTSPWRAVSGTYTLAPRLRLTEVNLRAGEESFTGRGSIQDDGRLIIVLTNGTKEMRMTGLWAKLRVEEGGK